MPIPSTPGAGPLFPDKDLLELLNRRVYDFKTGEKIVMEERDVIYEEIEDGEGNTVVIALAPGSNHLSIVCSEFATIRAGAELLKPELERLIEALHRAAVLIA